MYRTRLVSLSLFLVLTMAGCNGNGQNNNPYIVVNGTVTPCNVGSTCGYNNYYEVYNGKTYACSNLTGCDESNPITPPVPTAAPTSTQCLPNWVYDNLTDGGQSWVVVSRQQNVNNSTSPALETFTANVTKTVTVTDEKQVTTSLTGSTDILVIATITASVKSQINHTVSQSVTVDIGNSTSFSVPPGKTGYANYGVKVQVADGHLYDKTKCEGSKSDFGTDVTYVPIAAGWCTWLSNQPSPCPSV